MMFPGILGSLNWGVVIVMNSVHTFWTFFMPIFGE